MLRCKRIFELRNKYLLTILRILWIFKIVNTIFYIKYVFPMKQELKCGDGCVCNLPQAEKGFFSRIKKSPDYCSGCTAAYQKKLTHDEAWDEFVLSLKGKFG